MKINLWNDFNRLPKEDILELEEAIQTIERTEYVNWYDALPRGKVNEINLLDLALPAYLSAVPNFKSLLAGQGWSTLESKLKDASLALEEVSDEIELANWDDNAENRELLTKLFMSCIGGSNKNFPGFGPAATTKLLHKKRPHLIPIIDSWQLGAWGKGRNTWKTKEMADVAFEIRKEIRENQSFISDVKDGLSKSPHKDLSDIRIYDILFWENSRKLIERG